jgi:hypothetical protein
LKILVREIAVVDGADGEWQSSLEQACDQAPLPFLEFSGGMCQQREHLGGRSRGPGEKVSMRERIVAAHAQDEVSGAFRKVSALAVDVLGSMPVNRQQSRSPAARKQPSKL